MHVHVLGSIMEDFLLRWIIVRQSRRETHHQLIPLVLLTLLFHSMYEFRNPVNELSLDFLRNDRVRSHSFLTFPELIWSKDEQHLLIFS